MSSFMSPDLKLYPAVIELDNAPNIKLIKSGMSCTAEIIVKQYKEIVYVPVQSVIRVDGKPTVYIGSGSNPKPRIVEIGMSNNLNISIIKGLKGGEEVSLTPPLDKASVSAEPEEIEILEGIETFDPAKESTPEQPKPNMPSQGGNGQSPSGFGGGNMSMPSKDEMFKRSDADGDGKIAQSEFRMGEEQFKKMDKNGDGFIEASEFEIPKFDPSTFKMPRTKEELIKLSDKDGDSKISKSEYMGPEQLFGNSDKNGDGFITIDEAEIPSFGRGGAGGMGQQGGMPGGMPGGDGQGGNFGFPGGER
jgi:hypothetical protein